MSTKVCNSCGREVAESAKFCSECGGAFSIQKQGKIAAPKMGSGPIRETFLVLGVVAIITAGYFLFSTHQSVPKPPRQSSIPGHENLGDMGADLSNLPEDYDGLVSAGDNFMSQNNFAVAAECYKRALEIDGSSPDVRSDFGSCLYGMGLADRALEEFRTVREKFPLHSVSLFNLGIVFYGQNKSDSARYYFSKYLKMEPNGKASEQARTYLKELGV